MKKSEIRFSGELNDYVVSTLREPDVLRRLREETNRNPHAIMQIPPVQGQFMSFLVSALGIKKALETGTFTGYSALSVALALPEEGLLVACDINDDWAAVAKKYWQEAGVQQKIDFRLGAALETLDAMINDGEASSFDFAFIDADKGNYDHYYEKCLSLLRVGGVMAIDNVLLFGSVVDSSVLDDGDKPRFPEKDIQAMRDLNKKISADERVDQVMLPFADGITLVRKRAE